MTGTYVYNVDAKGRIVIPAAFREEGLDPFCWLTFYPDRFVGLYPGTVTPAHPEGAWRAPVCPNTGRVLVPVLLRRWCGLEPRTDAGIAGCGDYALLGPLAAIEARVRGHVR